MNRTLQYNTEKANLQMSEYGRIILEMVNHCLTIEDRQERLACAQHIVSVMASLAQEKASNPEVQSKLWNHLAYPEVPIVHRCSRVYVHPLNARIAYALRKASSNRS